MSEILKTLLVVLIIIGIVFVASSQKLIDLIREAAFDIFVLMCITAAGVAVVQWATGQ